MCTKYFMIDNLLEDFHMAIDLRCYGVERSSLILPFFLAKVRLSCYISQIFTRYVIVMYMIQSQNAYTPGQYSASCRTQATRCQTITEHPTGQSSQSPQGFIKAETCGQCLVELKLPEAKRSQSILL